MKVNGNAYTYYVTEVDADGNDWTRIGWKTDGNDWTPVNFEKEEDGMKVTNTYVSPTAGQTGTKEWAPPDLLDEYKVTVWFQLWRYIGSDPSRGKGRSRGKGADAWRSCGDYCNFEKEEDVDSPTAGQTPGHHQTGRV